MSALVNDVRIAGRSDFHPLFRVRAGRLGAGEHDYGAPPLGTFITFSNGKEPSEMNTQEKVKAGHLKRDAYLYVRQSSLQQVFNNQESMKRQYALRHRAVWGV